MRKFSFLALVIAAMTVGCSKNNTEIPDTSPIPDPLSPIHLSAGIEATTGSKAAIAGTTFPVNTDNVFRVTAFAGSAAPTDWTKESFNDQAVNSGNASALSFATTQYYPTNGDKLYFYAWAPQGSVPQGNGATTPVVNYTITGQEDIMAAQHTSGIAKSASQTHPSFAFTHKLKQVKFKLVADGSFETGIKVTSIKVKGAKTAGKLDISTGTLTFDTTTGDLSLPITTGTKDEITTAGTEMDGCIMFEQGTTFTVEIVAGGVTYDNVAITLTGSKAGEAGISHLVTLTFKRGGVNVTASIADWVSGAGVDVPIQ